MKIHFAFILFTVTIAGHVSGQIESRSKIVPDDYPITNEMLADTASDNSSYKIKSGEIYSLEKVWFTNDTLNQTLVIELYTDYHRLAIFHFYNNDIPTDLVKKMELYITTSKLANIFDTASYQQKQTYFKGFINSAIQINQHYFVTKKNFKLGDKKQKAISVYGNPDKCSVSNNFEECEWKFEGDIPVDNSKAKSIKPIAENSFGYKVIMFFKNEKLIAMILSNDIP